MPSNLATHINYYFFYDCHVKVMKITVAAINLPFFFFFEIELFDNFHRIYYIWFDSIFNKA